MRYIGISDSNNTPIFEGDTLEITNRADLCQFNESFIDELGITRMTMEILDRKGGVGVDIKCHFYAGDKQLTQLDEHKYFESNVSTDEERQELDKYFEGKDMSAPLTSTYESHNSSDFLYHGFIHRKTKTIIDNQIPIEGREKLVDELKTSDLTVRVNEQDYSALHTSFLVELTPDSKERILNAHDSLYSPVRYDGDFSHLLITPNEVSLYDYDLTCIPQDKDGNKTLYQVDHSFKKYTELRKPIMLKWHQQIKEWKDSHKELSEEEITAHVKSMLKEAEEECKPLKECEKTEEKKLMDTIFLGLSAGQNLFHFFEDMGCKVEPVEPMKS